MRATSANILYNLTIRRTIKLGNYIVRLENNYYNMDNVIDNFIFKVTNPERAAKRNGRVHEL